MDARLYRSNWFKALFSLGLEVIRTDDYWILFGKLEEDAHIRTCIPLHELQELEGFFQGKNVLFYEIQV